MFRIACPVGTPVQRPGLCIIHSAFCAPCPQASREFAAAASERLGLLVFPYSIFHIFFEQYLTIGGEALTLLGSGEGEEQEEGWWVCSWSVGWRHLLAEHRLA